MANNYDPLFRAQMPNSFNTPTNFGSYGGVGASGWNVNSAYLTPSFMAGYRPSYSGPNNMQLPYMSPMQGLNALTPTPWQPNIPYYMSAGQYHDQAMHAVATGVSDASAVGFNYIGTAGTTIAISAALQTKAMQGMLGGVGRGVGGAIGANLGSMGSGAYNLTNRFMLGGFLPKAPTAAISSFVGETGAGIGSMAARFAMPFAMGLAGGQMFDYAVAQPYLQGRSAAEAVRDLYAGRSLGMGSKYSPQGITSSRANEVGFRLARSFNSDLMWSGDTAAQIVKFGSQEGLFNSTNMQNPDAVIRRSKEMAAQVKLIMQVFNEPSMQGAFKMMGELARSGGAMGVMDTTRIATAFGVASGVSGVSTQQLASGIGMQGQMAFSQAGLLPYLGSIATARSFAGLSSAQHAGLISTNALAMMGGLEGAAQASVQGQAGLSNTVYNRMLAYNQYSLGGGANGIVGNLAKIGAASAKDPLGIRGGMILKGDMDVSQQMNANPVGYMQQFLQQANQMPSMFKSGGKYRVDAIASLMQDSGMSDVQIRALLTEVMHRGSQRGMDEDAQAASDKFRDWQTGVLDSESLLYNGFGGRSMRKLRLLARGIGNEGSLIGETVSTGIIDAFQAGRDALGDASTMRVLSNRSTTVNDLSRKRRYTTARWGDRNSDGVGAGDDGPTGRALRLVQAGVGDASLSKVLRKVVAGNLSFNDLKEDEKLAITRVSGDSNTDFFSGTRLSEAAATIDEYKSIQGDSRLKVKTESRTDFDDLFQKIASGVNGGLTEGTGVLGVLFGGDNKAIHGLLQDEWASILAFARENVSILNDPDGKLVSAINSNPRILGILKKAGYTATSGVAVIQKAAGVLSTSSQAYALSMAASSKESRTTGQLINGTAKNLSLLKASGWSGAGTTAGSKLGVDIAQVGLSTVANMLDEHAKDSTIKDTSDQFDWGDLSEAIKQQVGASETMDQAARLNYKAALLNIAQANPDFYNKLASLPHNDRENQQFAGIPTANDTPRWSFGLNKK